MDWYVLQLSDSSPHWFEASEEFPILLTSASLVDYSSQTEQRVVVSMSPVKESSTVTKEVPLCVLLPRKRESIPLQHLITAPNKVTLKNGNGAKVEISGIAIVGKLT
ncbi:hypothetical protein Gasu2_51190 [Galdieria sulphuraria]|uniref:Nucleoplasmin-like domain-containing protein n=1 Tax=Galdieria sulphuraria TaxID=130081 RepID=M2XLC8_GALSU|nr:hypothetical protein Gasu_17350 isoform 1 [Galdieria sulphuraria]EME30972.1 hypothetical protein Gasu_17350 isoform 1 [Galdieria sulphuraria]GJD10957.1 hypothetical protein Gasu2_51190 [Galdieria sulphuraria]|eukprot:XP_005707492.1 hypothetical protein isoform 1 [Galdieria sulphuraria]